MTRLSLGIVVTVLLAAGAAAAGQPRAQPMDRPYDPATEVTLTGTVTEVAMQAMGPARGAGPTGPGGGRAGMRGMGGVHLMLDTGAGTVEVHVGPVRFLEAEGVTFAAGDAIEVTGSRIDGEGPETLIARTITRGDTVLVLRNERGIPRWSGGPANR